MALNTLEIKLKILQNKYLVLHFPIELQLHFW